MRYPAEDFLQTFWKNSVEFYATVAKYISQWPTAAMNTMDVTSELPAARSHSLWASYSYISHAGSEAAIDLYHMSPAAIAQFTRTRSVDGLRLVPVTRVQMTVFELFRLLERAEKLVPILEEHVPATHKAPAGRPTAVEGA